MVGVWDPVYNGHSRDRELSAGDTGRQRVVTMQGADNSPGVAVLHVRACAHTNTYIHTHGVRLGSTAS